MKPTPIEFLLASRLMLPVWLGLAAYFWFAHGGDWNRFTEEQQLIIMAGGVVFGLFWLKALPTVFFYEREQAAYRRSAMSPEERWQRATVRQTFFLVLVAIALIYFGWQWWKSAPEPQTTTSYKAAAAGVGGVSLIATTAYLKVKTWRGGSEANQPAIVSWCLPVPRQTPSREQLVSQLPDYCRLVMNAGELKSPAPAPRIQPEGEHVPYGLA